MLPTEPTVVTNVVGSYLYFEYQNDDDLQALVAAYNQEQQANLDWFAWLNPAYYPGVSGQFQIDGVTYNYLDWVCQGIYGYPRPNLSTEVVGPFVGPTATYALAQYPTGNCYQSNSSTNTTCPDDIYKRCLTWNFYKGDGFTFSIRWLRRRIYRFLFGINGTDVVMGWTPTTDVQPEVTQNYAALASSPLASTALAGIETDSVGVPTNVSIQIINGYYTTVDINYGPTGTAPTSVMATSTFKQGTRQTFVYEEPTIVIVISGVDPNTTQFFIDAVYSGALNFPIGYEVVVNPQGE